MQATRRAPAKVNLSLLVGPRTKKGARALYRLCPGGYLRRAEIKLEARLGGGFEGNVRVKCRVAEETRTWRPRLSRAWRDSRAGSSTAASRSRSGSR